MASQATATINIKALFDASSAINSVNNLQKSLNNLKMPNNLKESATKTIGDLNKNLAEYQGLLNKGITTSADAKNVSKYFDTITKDFNKLSGIIGNIQKEFGDGIDLSKIITKPTSLINDLKKIETEINRIGTSLASDLSETITPKLDTKNFSKSVGKTVQELQKEFQDSLEDIKINPKIATESLKSLSTNIEKAINSSLSGAKKKAKNTEGLDENEAKQYKALFNKEGSINYDALSNSSLNTTGINNAKALLELLKEINNVAPKTGQALQELESKEKQRDNLTEDFTKSTAEGFRQVTSEVNNLTNAANNSNTSIRGIADATADFNKEIDGVGSRIKYFFGLDNAIRLVRNSLKEAFNTVKELDAAMTETAVVTDFSVSDMWDQLPKYTQTANQLGVTTKGAYETMTLFYQQGLKTNEVFEVGTETMKMARIAGLDYATATDYMTAALRGFNMEINETSAQRVNDVYSKLAAITASNTQEISVAMTKTASLANNANMEFESTAAYLSQIIETTRESAETAGTALKTVIARFTELKKDPAEISTVDGESVDANKIETALKSVGVALRDTNGEFRNLDDVFLDINKRWDSLTTNQQRYIATMAAGSRQQSRFIAMMSDYERTQELMSAAYNANGASEKQFEKTQESLESKLNKLSNAWDQFTMGLANSDAIKAAVDALTNLLNIVNKLLSIGGKGWTSLLSVGSIIGGLTLGKNVVGGIGKGIKGYASDTTGKSTLLGSVASGISENQKGSNKVISSLLGKSYLGKAMGWWQPEQESESSNKSAQIDQNIQATNSVETAVRDSTEQGHADTNAIIAAIKDEQDNSLDSNDKNKIPVETDKKDAAENKDNTQQTKIEDNKQQIQEKDNNSKNSTLAKSQPIIPKQDTEKYDKALEEKSNIEAELEKEKESLKGQKEKQSKYQKQLEEENKLKENGQQADSKTRIDLSKLSNKELNELLKEVKSNETFYAERVKALSETESNLYEKLSIARKERGIDLDNFEDGIGLEEAESIFPEIVALKNDLNKVRSELEDNTFKEIQYSVAAQDIKNQKKRNNPLYFQKKIYDDEGELIQPNSKIELPSNTEFKSDQNINILEENIKANQTEINKTESRIASLETSLAAVNKTIQENSPRTIEDIKTDLDIAKQNKTQALNNFENAVNNVADNIDNDSSNIENITSNNSNNEDILEQLTSPAIENKDSNYDPYDFNPESLAETFQDLSQNSDLSDAVSNAISGVEDTGIIDAVKEKFGAVKNWVKSSAGQKMIGGLGIVSGAASFVSSAISKNTDDERLKNIANGISEVTSVTSAAVSAIGPWGLAIGGVYAAYKILDAVIETDAEKLERLNETAEQAQQTAEEATKAYEDLVSGKNVHNTLLDELNKLQVGTEEFRNKLLEANAAAMSLIEANGFIYGQDYEYDKNGTIQFKQQSLKTAEEEQLKYKEQTAKNAAVANLAASQEKARQNYKEFSDFTGVDENGNHIYSALEIANGFKEFRGNNENIQLNDYLKTLEGDYSQALNTIKSEGFGTDVEGFAKAYSNGSLNQKTSSQAASDYANILHQVDTENSNLSSAAIDNLVNNYDPNVDNFYEDRLKEIEKLYKSEDDVRAKYEEVLGKRAGEDATIQEMQQEIAQTQAATNYTEKLNFEKKQLTEAGLKFNKDYKDLNADGLQALKQEVYSEEKRNKYTDKTNKIRQDFYEAQVNQYLAEQKNASVMAAKYGDYNTTDFATLTKDLSTNDYTKLAQATETLGQEFGANTVKSFTEAFANNEQFRTQFESINFTGNAITDLKLLKSEIEKTTDAQEELNSTFALGFEEIGGQASLLQELYYGQTEIIDGFDEIIKTEGDLTGEDILKAADSCSVLADYLELTDNNAQALADALMLIQSPDADVNDLSNSLLKAIDEATQLQNSLSGVYNFIDNKEFARSQKDIADFYSSAAEDAYSALSEGRWMDDKALDEMGVLFGSSFVDQYKKLLSEEPDNSVIESKLANEIKVLETLKDGQGLSGLWDYYSNKTPTEGQSSLADVLADYNFKIENGQVKLLDEALLTGTQDLIKALESSGLFEGNPELIDALVNDAAAYSKSTGILLEQGDILNGLKSLLGVNKDGTTSNKTQYVQQSDLANFIRMYGKDIGSIDPQQISDILGINIGADQLGEIAEAAKSGDNSKIEDIASKILDTVSGQRNIQKVNLENAKDYESYTNSFKTKKDAYDYFVNGLETGEDGAYDYEQIRKKALSITKDTDGAKDLITGLLEDNPNFSLSVKEVTYDDIEKKQQSKRTTLTGERSQQVDDAEKQLENNNDAIAAYEAGTNLTLGAIEQTNTLLGTICKLIALGDEEKEAIVDNNEKLKGTKEETPEYTTNTQNTASQSGNSTLTGAQTVHYSWKEILGYLNDLLSDKNKEEDKTEEETDIQAHKTSEEEVGTGKFKTSNGEEFQGNVINQSDYTAAQAEAAKMVTDLGLDAILTSTRIASEKYNSEMDGFFSESANAIAVQWYDNQAETIDILQHEVGHLLSNAISSDSLYTGTDWQKDLINNVIGSMPNGEDFLKASKQELAKQGYKPDQIYEELFANLIGGNNIGDIDISQFSEEFLNDSVVQEFLSGAFQGLAEQFDLADPQELFSRYMEWFKEEPVQNEQISSTKQINTEQVTSNFNNLDISGAISSVQEFNSHLLETDSLVTDISSSLSPNIEINTSEAVRNIVALKDALVDIKGDIEETKQAMDTTEKALNEFTAGQKGMGDSWRDAGDVVNEAEQAAKVASAIMESGGTKEQIAAMLNTYESKNFAGVNWANETAKIAQAYGFTVDEIYAAQKAQENYGAVLDSNKKVIEENASSIQTIGEAASTTSEDTITPQVESVDTSSISSSLTTIQSLAAQTTGEFQKWGQETGEASGNLATMVGFLQLIKSDANQTASAFTQGGGTSSHVTSMAGMSNWMLESRYGTTDLSTIMQQTGGMEQYMQNMSADAALYQSLINSGMDMVQARAEIEGMTAAQRDQAGAAALNTEAQNTQSESIQKTGETANTAKGNIEGLTTDITTLTTQLSTTQGAQDFINQFDSIDSKSQAVTSALNNIGSAITQASTAGDTTQVKQLSTAFSNLANTAVGEGIDLSGVQMPDSLEAEAEVVYNDEGHEPDLKPAPPVDVTYNDPGHSPNVSPTSITVSITYQDEGYTPKIAHGKIGSGSLIPGFATGKSSASIKASKNWYGQNQYSGHGAPREYEGIAQVGEEGPELMISNGQASLVGTNGPTFTYVHKNDTIFTTGQTKRILGSGFESNIPGYACGKKNIPGFAGGTLRNSYGAGIGSSKRQTYGGGGNGSDSEWENDFDWLYNYVQEIAELERKQVKLQEQYQKIVKDQSKSWKDLLDIQNKQLNNLYQQRDLQQFLADSRTKEMKDYLSTKSDLAQYGTYDFNTMQVTVDYDKIAAISDKDTYDKVTEYIDRLEEIEGQIEDATDALTDIDNSVIELMEESRDTYLDFEDRIYQALVESSQKQIDKLEEVSDALDDTNKSILDAANKAISKYRQDRDNSKTEEDLAEKERRLAYLRQDTSGNNALEIKQLEKELADSRENYLDSLVDQKLNDISDQQDFAAEQREKQIELMQNQLDYQEESGALWAEATRIFLESYDQESGVFNFSSELTDLLKEIDNYSGMSEIAQDKWREELNAAATPARTYFEQNYTVGEDDLGKTISVNYLDELGNVVNTLTGIVEKYEISKDSNGNIKYGYRVRGKEDGSETLIDYTDIARNYNERTWETTSKTTKMIEEETQKKVQEKIQETIQEIKNNVGSGSYTVTLSEKDRENIEKAANVQVQLDVLNQKLQNLGKNTYSDEVRVLNEAISKLNSEYSTYANNLKTSTANLTEQIKAQNKVVTSQQYGNTTWYSYNTGGVNYVSQNQDTLAKVAAVKNGTASKAVINWYREQFLANASGGMIQAYQKSLLGEEGPEIVWNKSKGYSYIAGENGPQYGQLRPGDQVFTAQETEAILNRPFLNIKDNSKSFMSNAAGTGASLGGDTTITINIDASLSNDYDVDQLTEKIKKDLYNAGSYRNINVINRIR